MMELQSKAKILASYANKADKLNEARVIVGFNKEERNEFVQIVNGFGYLHSSSQWIALYKHIKKRPWLNSKYPLMMAKEVNEFEVYAVTFALLLD